MKKLIVSLPAILVSACAIAPLQLRRAPATCSARAFDLIELERTAKAHVVLVKSDVGMGTGFVLADSDPRSISIVTNYHVIASGRQFEIDLPSAGGQPISIASVEIVKVDPAADLALIRVPRIERASPGLALSAAGVQLGQAIAAFGFPYVAGSQPTLTIERGDVTAAERVFGKESFVQTNANINPGNSGGPVLDACGEVVGVVVARVHETERVALIIPVAKVSALIALARTPAKDRQLAARTRLEAYFGALGGEDYLTATDLTSRRLLDTAISQLLVQAMLDTGAKMKDLREALARKGIDLKTLPKEKLERVTSAVLNRHDLEVLRLAELVHAKRLGERDAARSYNVLVTAEAFGKVAGFRVERFQLEQDHALATVSVDSDRGVARFRVVLREEWGDWQIAGFEKV